MGRQYLCGFVDDTSLIGCYLGTTISGGEPPPDMAGILIDFTISFLAFAVPCKSPLAMNFVGLGEVSSERLNWG